MDFNRIKIDLETKTSKFLEQLAEIAKNVSAEKLFTSVVTAMCLVPAEEISEASHGTVPAKIEILAYHLYPFFGLSENKNVLPQQVWFCQEVLDHFLMANSFPDSDELAADPAKSLAKTIERQAKIVRGSAYPQQTAEEIIGMQGYFDKWFEGSTGISPTKAQAALFQLFNLHQDFPNKYMGQVKTRANEFLEEWKRIKKIRPKHRTDQENTFLSNFGKRELAFGAGFTSALSNLSYEHYPIDLGSLPNLNPALSETEIEALINLIGITIDKRKKTAEIIEMRQSPLYVLPDKRVILVDLPNAMDALWEAFDQIARGDSKFWDGEYASRKGEWLEQKTIEHLEKIFPQKSIFKSLSYPDLSKSGKATAELDIAIEWGPFLLLIEAKAKQFRLESQLGDVGRLRTDIKKNVEDAFEQAKRAANFIANTATPEFKEIGSGRNLIVDKSKIKRTFLLTISLHNLAGLATTLATFQDIGLFRDSEYPFSISIADLEFVSEFCEGPDIFLNYVEKRLEVQKHYIEFRGDELDLLSAYLSTRLQKQNLWGSDDKEYNAILLTGWSEVFDRWIWHKQGLIADKPEIFLDIPQEIKEVLAILRANTDIQSKWIAFSLLSMPDSVLDAITGLILNLRSRQLRFGESVQGAKVVDGILICCVGGFGIPKHVLVERVKTLTKLEKKQGNVSRAIGFAIVANKSAKPFEHIELLESY